MRAEAIAGALGLRRMGRGWRGACPVHGGTSFTVDERDGRIVWTCWSGCDRGAILAELRRRGLWESPSEPPEEREQRRRQWVERRRLLETAELWRTAALRDVESRKVNLLAVIDSAGDPGDWLAWERSAAAEWALRRLAGDELLTAYQAAQAADAGATADLLAEQRRDVAQARRITAAIVAMLAAAGTERLAV